MDSERERTDERNGGEGEAEGRKPTTEAQGKSPDKEGDGEVETGKTEQKDKQVDEGKDAKDAGNEREVKGGEETQEEEEEEEGADEDEEDRAEKSKVTKGSKTEGPSDTGELSSPRTPGSDRPTRERRTVERFTIIATPRSSTPKPLAIKKGQGTHLKDIPNVTFKLSKRKADENLQLLHTILFGKKAKVHNLKKNIGLFSGFVWVENEEKQRAKVKEKLDKCVKEKLLDFCDVLDIPVNKTSVKKEELSVKLLEFLESPHAATEILLSNKEKSKRRKNNEPQRKSPGPSNADSGKSAKKQKIDSESGKKRKHLAEEEDNNNEPSDSGDNQDRDDKVPGSESDQEENDSELKMDSDKDKSKKQLDVKKDFSKSNSKKDGSSSGRKSKSVSRKGSAKLSSSSADKSAKNSTNSASKKGATESESKGKMKETKTKKQKTDKVVGKGSSLSAKETSAKVSKTYKGEGKSSKKANKEPTYEEMQAVVLDILQEVDFDTATLTDILRQLGKHFGVDLIHRKSEVKNIITEAIKNMSDDEDEEANGSGDDLGKGGQDDEA